MGILPLSLAFFGLAFLEGKMIFWQSEQTNADLSKLHSLFSEYEEVKRQYADVSQHVANLIRYKSDQEKVKPYINPAYLSNAWEYTYLDACTTQTELVLRRTHLKDEIKKVVHRLFPDVF